MVTVAYVFVALLLLAGLAGSVLPFLPGTPLILAGALVYALVTGFEPIGAGRLLILSGLTALAHILDYVGGAAGAKRFGGSRWAVIGAVIGGLIGFFFGPLGVLLGPVVGAVSGELLRSGELRNSLRSGIGAVVGMAAGAAAKFALAITMVGLVVWWIWRG
jgi:uncharacterized protein YqgC (DUF456 family)